MNIINNSRVHLFALLGLLPLGMIGCGGDGGHSNEEPLGLASSAKVEVSYPYNSDTELGFSGGTSPYSVELITGEGEVEYHHMASKARLTILAPNDVVLRLTDSAGRSLIAKIVVEDVTPELRISLPLTSKVGTVLFPRITGSAGQSQIEILDGAELGIGGSVDWFTRKTAGIVTVQVTDELDRQAVAQVQFYSNLGLDFSRLIRHDFYGLSTRFQGRVGAEGGVPPYKFAVLDAPTGTEINKDTGLLTTGDVAGSLRVLLTDSAGDTQTSLSLWVRKIPGSLDATFGDGGLVHVELPRGDSLAHLAADRSGNIYLGSDSASDAGVAAKIEKRDSAGNALQSMMIPGNSGWRYRFFKGLRVDKKDRVLAFFVVRLEDLSDVVRVHRFLTNGTPDPSFGELGVLSIEEKGSFEGPNLVVLEDGGFIVSGKSTNRSGDTISVNTVVKRYSENGKIDEMFGDGGSVIVPVNIDSFRDTDYMSLQIREGSVRILVAGSVANEVRGPAVESGNKLAVYALTLEGTADVTYGEQGLFTYKVRHRPYFEHASAYYFDERVHSSAMLADGTLLLTGSVAFTPFIMTVDSDGKKSSVKVFTQQIGDYLAPILSVIALGDGERVLLKKRAFEYSTEDSVRDRSRFQIVSIDERYGKIKPSNVFTLNTRQYKTVSPGLEAMVWWVCNDRVKPVLLPDGGILFGGEHLVKTVGVK